MSARTVVLRMTPAEARSTHLALGTTVTLMDHVERDGGVPKNAPLYGQRNTLVEVAQRLDHEINHAPREASDAA